MIKDYYSILGVSLKAEIDEIKSSYRKLAFAYHPDKNPGDKAAEEKFKEVSEAYSVLSDPNKRSQYDSACSMGTEYRENGPMQQGAPFGFDFNFGFAFSQEMAQAMFYREMSELAAELTINKIPKDKIAEELMRRGCPLEVAHKIASSFEGKRRELIRTRAQAMLSRGLGFLVGAVFTYFVPVFRIFSLFLLLFGAVELVRAIWFFITGRTLGRA